MSVLAAILIAVSIVDWLYPDGPEPRTLFVLTTGVLAVAAGTVTYLASSSWIVALLTALSLVVGTLTWAGLRKHSNKRYRGIALSALAAMIATGALLIPALNPEGMPQEPTLQLHLASYLDRLPWHPLARMNPEILLLTTGMLLFLGSTSNAIVRTAMTLIRSTPTATAGEPQQEAPEEQLKGGRYIGPLERWLIFGLALAGQPTAAALVISAKSIIRFPELQSKATSQESPASAATGSPPGTLQRIDELTEYFLIGSLLSWLLALLAALPIVSLSQLP